MGKSSGDVKMEINTTTNIKEGLEVQREKTVGECIFSGTEDYKPDHIRGYDVVWHRPGMDATIVSEVHIGKVPYLPLYAVIEDPQHSGLMRRNIIPKNQELRGLRLGLKSADRCAQKTAFDIAKRVGNINGYPVLEEILGILN